MYTSPMQHAVGCVWSAGAGSAQQLVAGTLEIGRGALDVLDQRDPPGASSPSSALMITSVEMLAVKGTSVNHA